MLMQFFQFLGKEQKVKRKERAAKRRIPKYKLFCDDYQWPNRKYSFNILTKFRDNEKPPAPNLEGSDLGDAFIYKEGMKKMSG